MFVDRVKIHVQAGNGGDGCVSFRHEKRVPRGGPDGGDGGRGGSIILLAEEGVDSLDFLAHRKHWKAESGERGSGAGCHGRGAADMVLRVPPGTVVIDAEGGFIVKDLAAPGEQVTVARGGKGGKGNLRFKTSTNRAPRESTPGEQGESHHLLERARCSAACRAPGPRLPRTPSPPSTRTWGG
jgi:GTP-binding protein